VSRELKGIAFPANSAKVERPQRLEGVGARMDNTYCGRVEGERFLLSGQQLQTMPKQNPRFTDDLRQGEITRFWPRFTISGV
jgi:hypothetical protein